MTQTGAEESKAMTRSECEKAGMWIHQSNKLDAHQIAKPVQIPLSQRVPKLSRFLALNRRVLIQPKLQVPNRRMSRHTKFLTHYNRVLKSGKL